MFDKYKSVSSVVLKDLSERDAKRVLQVFKKINRFAMQNMVIIEDITGLPQRLSELTLIDCNIERELMQEWMSFSKSTLLRLKLDNFKHQLTSARPDVICGLAVKEWPVLRYSADKFRFLTIKDDDSYYRDVLQSTVGFLSVSVKHMPQSKLNFDRPTSTLTGIYRVRFYTKVVIP